MLKDLLMLITLTVAIIMYYIAAREELTAKHNILTTIGLVLLLIADILIIFS